MDTILQYTNSVASMNVVVQQMITTVQPFGSIIDNGMTVAAVRVNDTTEKVGELNRGLEEIDKEHRIKIDTGALDEAISKAQELKQQFDSYKPTVDTAARGSAKILPGVVNTLSPVSIAKETEERRSGASGAKVIQPAVVGLASKPGDADNSIPGQVAQMQSLAESTKNVTGITQQFEQEHVNLADKLSPFVNLMQSCTDLTRQFGVDTSAVQPIIDGLNASLGIYNAIMDISKIQVGEFTIAEWLLNAAFWANPITWIVAGIIALIAIIAVAWNKFAGFREVVMGVWESMKAFGSLLKDLIIDRIRDIINGIGGIGKAIGLLFKGKFGEAVDTAKQAVVDLSGVNTVKEAVKGTEVIKDAFATRAQNQQVVDEKARAEKAPAKVAPGYTVPGIFGQGNPAIFQQMTQQVSMSQGTVTNRGLVQQGQSGGASPQAGNITAGGSKNITINIGKFFDNMNISAQRMSEGMDDFERRVEEVFLRIVNSANTVNG